MEALSIKEIFTTLEVRTPFTCCIIFPRPRSMRPGTAVVRHGPALPNEQLACGAGSRWLQQTTFAFLLLLKHWPKVIVTYPDGVTLNYMLGMFLKYFSEQ